MAAYSTLNGRQIQQTVTAFLRIESSPGELFRPSPSYHYIVAAIDEEVKEKIMNTISSILESFSRTGIIRCVRIQFGRQPNVMKKSAPPCKDAIFKRKWASYSVPIIDADKCFGALEVITDTPSDSHDNDILAISIALQHAGLQFSFPCNPPSDLKMKGVKERKRTTKTSEVTGYRCLVPYMGLKKEIAAERLGQASAANEAIKETTFDNLRRNVGIRRWAVRKKCKWESYFCP
ncbi:hypothetical protein E3N88_30887 [Mikania micrantha]|uniref:Uncharacterized protein n=1 Tax=Mikania micrantha TaxID=192012 RepID=A0A5N6MNC6_9ASTR|nr:hypothetical protein E3N88_30887 [Mikania micrantha]